jgi:molecular chaperone DnaK
MLVSRLLTYKEVVMLKLSCFLLFYVDGIVNVSAKDKATGKDQSMTIASSSGLSDKDIEKMVSDAEQFAETDKARRSLIEEANKADSVCADTEKG